MQTDDWPSVTHWRRGERERLIAERMELRHDERAHRAEAVIAELDRLDLAPGSTLSFYWPFRGEFDLRSWAAGLQERGVTAVLPVVVEKNRPMTFRAWAPGCRMERGIWNIPVPADGPEVVPDIVIAPLVGHDPECYRLGYGGGYFDRTLAVLSPKPFVVGIGLSSGRLPSIRPQPHDIPMDAIITEAGRWGR
jgi:5,10-methenyltetrahydrofolate synthetase